MGADEVLGRARVDAQEIAIVSLALYLIPIVLIGGQLGHHLLTEDRGFFAVGILNAAKVVQTEIRRDGGKQNKRNPNQSRILQPDLGR